MRSSTPPPNVPAAAAPANAAAPVAEAPRTYPLEEQK
jgi:hypothetical protein